MNVLKGTSQKKEHTQKRLQFPNKLPTMNSKKDLNHMSQSTQRSPLNVSAINVLHSIILHLSYSIQSITLLLIQQ